MNFQSMIPPFMFTIRNDTGAFNSDELKLKHVIEKQEIKIKETRRDRDTDLYRSNNVIDSKLHKKEAPFSVAHMDIKVIGTGLEIRQHVQAC